jgi:Tfp pilus assembly protein PilX
MRLATRLRQERGIALVLALGIMLSLAITLTAVIQYTTSNSKASAVDQSRQSADQIAEAGLNAAYSILNYWDTASGTGNNANNPALLGCASGANGASDCTTVTKTCVSVLTTCASATTVGQAGTASVWGTYTGLNTPANLWTITSTGYARNDNGPVFKKTLTATSSVTWNNTQPANVAAWDYAFATGTTNSTTCDVSVPNSVVIDSSLYVAGNLCLTNSASIQETSKPVTLNVRGKIAFANSSFVGTSAKKLSNGTVLGGCGTSLASTHTCSSATDPYWVAQDTGQPVVAAPTMSAANMDSYYNSANPGPKHACDSATRTGSYPTWDNDTTRNGTAPSFNLTPVASYTCKGYDANGNLVGELSWNVSTHTLTIKGTMYMDGPVTSTDASATYQGSATLYVGTFTMANTAQLCSNTGCDFASWNPNTEMLLIVATAASGTAIGMSQSVKFQGGLFANAAINFANSVAIMGPMIGGDLVWGNSVTVQPLPSINTLPIGAPGTPNVHAQPGPLVYK